MSAHSNLNVMTPGYWMLFGIAADGVYSKAKVIQVDSALGIAITDPGSQFSTINTAASLQIQATSPAGITKNFSATGLPDGLSIHGATGLISGTDDTQRRVQRSCDRDREQSDGDPDLLMDRAADQYGQRDDPARMVAGHSRIQTSHR